MITNLLITDFLTCRQRAFLTLTRPSDTPSELELHRQRIVKHIMALFIRDHENLIIQNCTLDNLRPPDLAHLSSPAYIISPSFASNTSQLTMDAIKILPPSSETSKLTCIPIKASSNVAVSKNDRLELCVIALLLQKHAPHLQCSHCTIMTAWNAKTATFAIETHIREARRYLRQLVAMNDKPSQPRYYRNEHCKTCPNKTACEDELTSKDDLSLLVSMTPTQIDKLNARGILTVNQLSYTFRCPKNQTAAPLPARPIFSLKALALREKQTYIIEPPIFPDHPTEIFVDFEGFPDERCVYLIGMIIRDKQREITKSFWADSLNDTNTIMTEFLRELSSIGVYTMYHFGSFEARALRSFGRQTKNSLSDEIDAILAKSGNVLTLFSQNVYTPTYTNGLKEIAGFLGFKWATPDISGPESLVLRQKWELDGLETDGCGLNLM